MTTQAEITEAERILSRLLRDYRLREPYEPIVQHALRETFEESFPELAEDFAIRMRRGHKPGPLTLAVELVERSAVDRLGNLA